MQQTVGISGRFSQQRVGFNAWKGRKMGRN